jgi:hypothetical protein
MPTKKREEFSTEDIIKIAVEFAEDAYHNLKFPVSKLLKDLDLNACKNEKEVYNTGRMILFMLQLASEKAIKAYLLVFFRSWINLMVSIGEEIDRNKLSIVKYTHEELKELNNKLEPRQISHRPHETFLNVLCKLYKLLFERKKEMIKYIELLEEKLLQYPERFYDISEGFIKGKSNSSLAKRAVIKYVIDDIFKQFLEKSKKSIEEFNLSEESQKNIRSTCNELKYKRELYRLFLPCFPDEKGFRNIRLYREDLSRKIEEIKEDVKKQLWEEIDGIVLQLKKRIEIELGKAGDNNIKAYKTDLKKLFIETLEKNEQLIKNVIEGYLFIFSLSTYLLLIYQCLAPYTIIGRYPTLVLEKRNEICHDIEKIKLIKEEIMYIVEKIRSYVEAYYKLYTQT